MEVSPFSEQKESQAPLTPLVPLTSRESQILGLVRKGFTNKMIARTLDIALSTAKNHVCTVLMKLGVHRRVEIIMRGDQ